MTARCKTKTTISLHERSGGRIKENKKSIPLQEG